MRLQIGQRSILTRHLVHTRWPLSHWYVGGGIVSRQMGHSKNIKTDDMHAERRCRFLGIGPQQSACIWESYVEKKNIEKIRCLQKTLFWIGLLLRMWVHHYDAETEKQSKSIEWKHSGVSWLEKYVLSFFVVKTEEIWQITWNEA